MLIGLQVLSSVMLNDVGLVVANDAARSSFTVTSGDDLLALDQNLNVLDRWPLGSAERGCHATSPGRGLALVSGRNEVRLVGEAGQTIWSYPHVGWNADFESGCTWFDAAGEPHAVIPAANYDHCLVIKFDLESGTLLATAPIQAAPAGIHPVHHPNGWVGLSAGEGQDAAKAWWVRSATPPGGPTRVELIDAGWDDLVFSDVHVSGMKIITTPHGAGSLTVRSFPSLEILVSIDPPQAENYCGWDFTACFADGDLIVNKLIGDDERLAVIDLNGRIQDLGEYGGWWLIPAADGTWLSATHSTIRRWKLTQQQSLW